MGGNLRGGGGFKVLASFGTGFVAGTTVRDITISAVDLTKCVVVLTGVTPNASSESSNDYNILIRFLNSTTVRVERFTTPNVDVLFSWAIIEFSGAKSIQSGYVTTGAGAGSPSTFNQPIASVNTGKALAFVSQRVDATASGTRTVLFDVYISSATNLQIVRWQNQSMTFQYFIVEYP